MVEPWMVAQRFDGPDHGPTRAGESASLPLRLGRHPVRRQRPHAPIDAERAFASVLDGEIGILGETQDVAVGVDDHGAPIAPATGGRLTL